ncbi:MAG: insulinase family protein [Verrucomicrobia bacterium]|nr:insulinase family protein [Verrucomicrobiota bacterium]
MSAAIYDWRRIPGGPRVAAANIAGAECVAMSVHVPAGGRDDADAPAGLAHFVEHMVFKGTARRTARELSIEIENSGCQVNAYTSEDQTVYEGRGEAGSFDVLADVLCDMVWHAAFPEQEIVLEREVIGEEIAMIHDTPSDYIGDMLSTALWGAHPLGRPISGTTASIAAIDRAALVSSRDRHHLREDVVISVAGPFDIDDVLGRIRGLLPESWHVAPRSMPFDAACAAPASLVESRDTGQLQLALGWHTCGRMSASRHTLRLLSLILGDSASSRLFLSLREERGLCYQISSDVSLLEETGALEIHAGLEPENRDEAIDLIRREIRDLANHGPRPGELDRAKRLAITQAKLAFETTSAHAAWAADGLLDFGRIPSPAEWRSEINRVSDRDLREIAAQVFTRDPSTAEIRPLP